jgi:hypothetical protein
VDKFEKMNEHKTKMITLKQDLALKYKEINKCKEVLPLSQKKYHIWRGGYDLSQKKYHIPFERYGLSQKKYHNVIFFLRRRK